MAVRRGSRLSPGKNTAESLLNHGENSASTGRIGGRTRFGTPPASRHNEHMTAEDTTTLTSARLDLWLWSVRIFKTRSLAADECKGGHVRVNDAPAKPSQKLKKGDVVRVRYPGWERIFKVEKLLVKRVGAPIAVTCYEDLSGPRPAYLSMPPVAKRERGSGRPTKKERRALDELRGRGV